MPITITSLSRPTNCNHVEIVANVDGVSRTAHVHVDEVLDVIKASGLDYRLVLTMCWIKYRRDGGSTWQSLVGKTVA